MPHIVKGGEYVAELGGVVSGGATAVVHHPDEVDGLLAVCALAPRPPELPMTGIYRAFADPTLELEAWARHWVASLHSLPESYPSPGTATPPMRASHDATPNGESDGETSEASHTHEWPESDVALLQQALVIARALWKARPEDIPALKLIVTIADPASSSHGRLELPSGVAALSFTKGSLIAKLAGIPLRPAVFFVGLVAGTGATPSARVNNLVARLRQAALDRGAFNLRDVRDVPPADVANKRLIVLLHGLLSIDVGTFGDVEVALRKREQEAKDIVLAGFSHDSVLSSIKANALELARALGRFPGTSIRFVCHSRGGLVARQAALELMKAGLPAPPPRIGRCATFGTPHLGAAHPEGPGGFVALYVTLQLLAGSRSGASVLDALSCWTVSEGFPGINDLMSDRTGTGFLSELQDKEGLYPNSTMPLFVVGGARKPRNMRESLMSRPLEGSENDLVVSLRSAMPPLGPGGQTDQRACDHFSYFDRMPPALLDRVVTYVANP